MELPPWIDREAWHEFADMRRRIKKPLTDRAAMRILNRLAEMKGKGHDPNRSLIQSADCYWLDVYAPKDREIQSTPSSSANACIQATRALLDDMEQSKQMAVPPPERLLRMVGKA